MFTQSGLAHKQMAWQKYPKSMLRKAATKEGRDWDKMILFLLFAYREVPQSSSGFSPF